MRYVQTLLPAASQAKLCGLALHQSPTNYGSEPQDWIGNTRGSSGIYSASKRDERHLIIQRGKDKSLSQLNYLPTRGKAFNPGPLPPYSRGSDSTSASAFTVNEQLVNPFTPMNCNCCHTSTSAALPFPPWTVSPFTSYKPQHVGPSHGVQALGCENTPPGEASSPRGGEPKLCSYDQHNPNSCSSHSLRCDGAGDGSDNERDGQKERIPTLRPSHFNGSGAWKDFLYQFESCAWAYHWSEKTVVVQLQCNQSGWCYRP